MRKTLVRGRQVLQGFTSGDSPLLRADAAVLVEAGLVLAVGPADTLAQAHPDAEQVGGSGFIVIPGLVNA
ncbi:MAG: hypothetical protein LH632_08030, partial [Rhodoferax sp.]|nr:hypothetical protein [Rhodoferax sp.]